MGTMTLKVHQLDFAARGVLRNRANASEVGVVPRQKCRQLHSEVRLRKVRAEVFVGLFAGGERSGESDAEVAVHVVIAWDHEQAALIELRGAQDIVEEFPC
jgi:hypothetical protein